MTLEETSRRQFLRVSGATLAGVALLNGSKQSGGAKSSESWPQFRYDAGHTAYAPNNTGPRTDIKLGWSFQTNDDSSVSPPVISSNTVYVGSSNGDVHALSLDDGNEKWRYNLAEEIVTKTSPIIAGGELYIRTRRNGGGESITALDATNGALQWRYNPLGDDGIYSLRFNDETIYFLNQGNVHSVNVDDGDRKWTLEGNYSFLSIMRDNLYCTPDFSGAEYPFHERTIDVIDIQNGAIRYSFTVEIDVTSLFGNGESLYVIGDSLNYGRFGDESLFRLEKQSGDTLWKSDIIEWAYNQMVVTPTKIFATDDSGTIYSLDNSSGKEQWTYDIDINDFLKTPIIAGDTLYFGQYNKIHALAADDGTQRWSFQLNDSNLSTLIVANGSVVGVGDDTVFKITGEVDTPTPTSANTPSPSPTSTNTPSPSPTDTPTTTPISVSSKTPGGGDEDETNFVPVGIGLLGLGGAGAWWLSRRSDTSSGESDNDNSTEEMRDPPLNDKPTENTGGPPPTMFEYYKYHDLGYTPQKRIRHTIGDTAIQINDLIQTYEQDQLESLPDRTDEETLSIRIFQRLDKARDTIVDEVEDAIEGEPDGKPPMRAVLQHRSFDDSRIDRYVNRNTDWDLYDVDTLWDRYEELRDQNIQVPQHDSETGETKLTEAGKALVSGDFDRAEKLLDEAERLTGPSVQYLLTQARQATDEAQSTEEEDDLEEAIEQWKQARDQYEEALKRAEEIDDPMADPIEESISTVITRLESVKKDYAEREVRESLTDAWIAVQDGDALYEEAEFIPEDVAREYDNAVDSYQSALNTIPHSKSVIVDPDDIKQAIDVLRAALQDYEIHSLIEQLETGILTLSESEYSKSETEFDEVLIKLNEIEREANAIREIALHGVFLCDIKRVKSLIQQAETQFADEEYHETEDILKSASTKIDGTRDYLRKRGFSELPSDLQRTLDELNKCCREHRDTIKQTLTEIDAEPSFNLVDEIEIPPEPVLEDVPNSRSFCQSIPVAPRIWEAVAPDEYTEYQAVRSVIETVHETDIKRWVGREQNDRIDAIDSDLETVDPIMERDKLDTLREEIQSFCLDIVETLTNRLDESLTTLEEADLPDDFYQRPDSLGESTTSLDDIEDLASFEREWKNKVDLLTDALATLDEAVSVVESYDEVAAIIEETLSESDKVTADDLPVKDKEPFFKLYAFRNSGVSFDENWRVLRHGGR